MASKKKNKPSAVIHIDPKVKKAIGKKIYEYTQSMKDDGMRKAKDKFMDLYQKVELAYKELLTEYVIKVEGKKAVSENPGKGEFNPRNQKIVDSQVVKVMAFAQIPLEEKLFCKNEEFYKEGNKSCRILRDEIIHASSKKAIEEVYKRKDNLYQVMDAFLGYFPKPENVDGE